MLTNLSKEKKIKIFISHSCKNRDIANALSVLIQIGAKLHDVFCSTRPGDDIINGFDFVEDIDKNIRECDLFIALFSPHYIDSQYCMVELGMAHILNKKFFPILLPGVGFDQTTALCAKLQIIKIDDSEKLSDLSDVIRDSGHQHKTTTWTTAQKEFLEKIEPMLANQVKPNRIEYKQYENIYNENQRLKVSNKNLREQLLKTEEQIEQISKLKDKEEVNEIITNINTDNIETFEYMCKDVSNELKQFSRAVQYLCFKYYADEMCAYRDVLDGYGLSNDDIEKRYVTCDGNEVYISKDSRKLTDLFQKINDLDSFLKSPSNDLINYINKEYDLDVDMSNKEFWNECFNINI